MEGKYILEIKLAKAGFITKEYCSRFDLFGDWGGEDMLDGGLVGHLASNCRGQNNGL